MKDFPPFETDCPCRLPFKGNDEALIPTFERTREGCAALSKLLAPDDVWAGIRAEAEGEPDSAAHRPYLLLAFERGHLDAITLPVHRYLMEGRDARGDLSRQYEQDLKERWLLAKRDEAARHRMFRGFFGKPVELRFADWLDHNGWEVTDLEALGGPSDISGIDSEGHNHEFEVKYIGRSDGQFALLLEQFKTNVPTPGFVPVYAAANFVLFKAYEAAKQLAGKALHGTAVIVIDDQTWYSFETQLRNGWIDWNNPKFLDDAEPCWKGFFQSIRESQYPSIDTDLVEVIGTLDAVWIHRIEGYFLKPEQEIPVRVGSDL